MNDPLVIRVAARFVDAVGGKSITLQEFEKKHKAAFKQVEKVISEAGQLDMSQAVVKAHRILDKVEEWIRWIDSDKYPEKPDYAAIRDVCWKARGRIKELADQEITKIIREQEKALEATRQKVQDMDPATTQYQKELDLLRAKH